MRFEHKFSKWMRKKEALAVLSKFPTRVPVIVQINPTSRKALGILRKKKYLVPVDLKMGQFMGILRARMRLKPQISLFGIVKNKIPNTGALVISVYHELKDDDQFLYIDLCAENTFG